MDACGRKVIGNALFKRIDTPLALTTLTAAYSIRKPVPGTCIYHKDRVLICKCLIPGFFGRIWSDRIDECASQSISQRPGGELHEDA
ncbi:hypothetical protein [Herbaspirillum frisingense]|uniref:hypothetical protein n=1 Tax=Herbaspirillum frisingense TaxID=92645 RepID=UPI0035B548E0